MGEVEFRCPVKRQRLFGKLDVPEDATVTVSGAVVSVACDDCRKAARRMGQSMRLVVHRFDMTGRCVATLLTRGEPGA